MHDNVVWMCRITLTGTLTEEQFGRVLADKPDAAIMDEDRHTVELRLAVQGKDFRKAMAAAEAAYSGLPGVAQLVTEGLLASPHRFELVTAAAYEWADGK